MLWQVGPWLTARCYKTSEILGETPSTDHPRFQVNDCAPPPRSLSPGGVPIAALLLGSIEAPHEEAFSQLARASEVTWKWSVISLLLVFRVRLADPVHA